MFEGKPAVVQVQKKRRVQFASENYYVTEPKHTTLASRLPKRVWRRDCSTGFNPRLLYAKPRVFLLPGVPDKRCKSAPMESPANVFHRSLLHNSDRDHMSHRPFG